MLLDDLLKAFYRACNKKQIVLSKLSVVYCVYAGILLP